MLFFYPDKTGKQVEVSSPNVVCQVEGLEEWMILERNPMTEHETGDVIQNVHVADVCGNS